LFYTSDSAGTPELVTKAIGGGQETKVGVGASLIFSTAISPDDDVLVGRATTVASFDVMTLQLTAREPPSPLFATAANEAEATLTFRETRRQYDVDRNPHAVAHTEVERAGGTGHRMDSITA
jgi:hypothetical protein